MNDQPPPAWVIDALVAQIRQLERRAGRAAHSVRLCALHAPALIQEALHAHLPSLLIEVEPGPGPARVISLSFNAETL